MAMNKLLIANRGEIARRIARTCRARRIQVVAVFSDADATEPFVREADEAVRLPGVTPGETYLDGNAVIAAALRTDADAVHPGYGFLSENAGFARACTDAGLIFIGPSPDAIDAMGSKLRARELMGAAGVPLLPAAEVELDDIDGFVAAADDIGYPILVKASFGGGGRGMRRVDDGDDLVEAVKSATSESSRAFGSGVVYLEKYLTRARHVEVQLAGDLHGDVAHLLERDCSLQRRHQKVIEEAPAPFLSDAARETLHAAGVAAARAVSYHSVGTAEFLVSGDQVYFLEMNTRLQVEHPVTEEVTGLDLVGIQLDIATGARLADLGIPVTGASGHAIEARLYAEDTANGFAPATGTLHHVSFPDLPGVRIESGVESGSVISPYYDSMLAKIVAHGPDRGAAISLLTQALRATRVDGVTTNRTLLLALLADAEFAGQAGDTQLLERRDIAALSRADAAPQARALHALAATLAAHAARQMTSPFAALPPGWRNNPSGSQLFGFADDDGELTVGYRFTRDGLLAQVDDVDVGDLHAYQLSPDSVDFEADGVRRRYQVRRSGGLTYVDSALGSTTLRETDRLPAPETEVAPGSLTATAPGMVLDVLVAEGDQVGEGQPLMVIESMKMETRVSAPYRGTVAELRVRKGALLEAGAVLAVIASEAETGTAGE